MVLHQGHLVFFPVSLLAISLRKPILPTPLAFAVAISYMCDFVMHLSLRFFPLPCLFLFLDNFSPSSKTQFNPSITSSRKPSFSVHLWLCYKKRRCWASLLYLFTLLYSYCFICLSPWSGWGKNYFLSFYYQSLAEYLLVWKSNWEKNIIFYNPAPLFVLVLSVISLVCFMLDLFRCNYMHRYVPLAQI